MATTRLTTRDDLTPTTADPDHRAEPKSQSATNRQVDRFPDRRSEKYPDTRPFSYPLLNRQTEYPVMQADNGLVAIFGQSGRAPIIARELNLAKPTGHIGTIVNRAVTHHNRSVVLDCGM